MNIKAGSIIVKVLTRVRMSIIYKSITLESRGRNQIMQMMALLKSVTILRTITFFSMNLQCTLLGIADAKKLLDHSINEVIYHSETLLISIYLSIANERANLNGSGIIK